MTIQELLIANGIDEATATKVLDDMKTNKLYTTSVENADTRYTKMKEKHDALAVQMTEATTALEALKAANPDEMKTDYEKLKGDYETLQGESAKKIKDYAINSEVKSLMKAHKAKEKYADLLAGKIDKESLELAEDGTVTGLEDLFKGLTTEYADLFEASAPALGGTPPANNGSSGSADSALIAQIRNSMNKK